MAASDGNPIELLDRDAWRMIVDRSSVGIIIVSAELEILYANRAALELVGCDSLEQMKSVPRHLFIHPDQIDVYMERWEQYFRQGNIKSPLRLKIVRRDGQVRQVEIVSTPLTIGGRSHFLTFFSDVTELQSIERELVHSAQVLAACFDRSPLGIAFTDPEGVVKAWSDEAHRMFGFTREEVVGRLDPTIPPELEESYRQDFETIVASGEGQSLSTWRRTKDGTRVDLRLSVTPFLGGDENLAGVLAIFDDVTERQRAERALRVSEERFRTAAAIANDLIYEWDGRSGRYEWFGDIDGLLGYAPGEFPRDLFGANAHIHRDDRTRVLAAIEAYVRGDKPFHEEYRLRRNDGGYLTVLSRAIMIPSEDGHFRWIGVNTDITDWKRTEEELRRSLLQLDTVFNVIIDGLIIADAETKRLLRVNPAACRMLGYAEDELLKLSVYDLHPPDRIEEVIVIFNAAARGDRTAKPELHLQRKDGTVIIADVRANAVEFEGRDCVIGVFRDVTKRKQIEDALRESEERFKTYVNDSAYGYVEFDLEGYFTFANKRQEEFSGYRVEDHVNFRDIIIPEDLERAVQDLIKAATLPNAGPREYRFRVKDGSIRHFEVNTLPLKRNGVLVGFQSSALDITERKIAEAALKESEERFKTYVNESVYGYVELDLAANYTFVNKRLEEITGYQVEDRLNLRDVIVPEDLERTLRNLSQVQARPSAGPHEYRIRIKDGAVRHIEVNTLPIRRDGAMVGYQASVLDITERKQAEAALRDSEKKYRLLAENMTDLIFQSSLDWRFQYISPSIETLLGYPIDQALRFSVVEIMHPEDFARVNQVFQGIYANEREGHSPPGASYVSEFRLRHLDGHYLWIEANWSFLRDERGEIVSIQGLMRDITERKQSELALKQSEDKARAQFMAIPVPTYIWQKHGDDFILTDFNEAAIAITQGAISRLQGVAATVLYREKSEIVADMERCYQDQINFGKYMLYEFQSLSKVAHLNVKFAFIPPDVVLVHTEDVTEQKLAEEALAESERRLSLAFKEQVRQLRSRDYVLPYGADADYHHYRAPAMRRVFEEALLAATSDVTLCLLGKSGVGKSYLAGWIHQRSARREQPFFDINCAALAPALIESELFGHEAGAFTDAKGMKRGLLELAHQGTLFLDEIGELPLALQTKLHDFLDQRKIRRLGGEKFIHVDARIIVATNRDLERLVAEGKFREDLYYRLSVLTITVPTLKQRKEDIPTLANEILERLAHDLGLKETPKFTPDAIEQLLDHDWPGNIRELRNALERALLRNLGQPEISDIAILKPSIQTPDKSAPGGKSFVFPKDGVDLNLMVDDFERDLVQKALKLGGTKIKAAELLRISRHAIHRYIRKLGIDERK